MKRDKIACHCRRVSYGDIVDAVAAGATTFAEVSAKTGFITHMVADIQRYPEDYDLPKKTES